MTATPQTRAATIAGAMYILQMTTAVIGYLIRSSLGVPGDAAATAENIMRAEWLYRLSIVSDLATISAVIVLTWALYVLLRPVGPDWALLAAFFRLVENAVLAVMSVALLVGLALLTPGDYLTTFETGQLHTLARVARIGHSVGFGVGFIFVGLGSAIFASLLWKSRYVPRLVAGWGIGASCLLAMGSALSIVLPSSAQVLQVASFGPMGIYEVALGAWLLVRGASLATPAAGAV